jgi:hypothetical protein
VSGLGLLVILLACHTKGCGLSLDSTVLSPPPRIALQQILFVASIVAEFVAEFVADKWKRKLKSGK